MLFLVASDEELLRRFAETRRTHPLSRSGESLREAIAIERALLEPIAAGRRPGHRHLAAWACTSCAS